MAKLITKFKYIKPGKNVGNYLKYIATREGVDKIDDSKRYHHVTKKQEKFIENILQDFPDSAEMLEYEDYKKEMTIGAASEFITRAAEDNASSVMDRKTYADYIATRPRVQRFGSHGLFTDDGVEIKLSNISEELNLYEGNVWTGIISLRREDAVRLGFDCGERWRDMMRTQVPILSECLKIPMENLKWFAAFHDESHHPHAHLMVYSTEPGEGYLSKQGLMRLRSSFAKDIFAQELLSVYQKQTEYRDELKSVSKENISEIIEKINTGCYDNPKTEDLIVKLADRLNKVKGKKVYGYLHSDIKDMVDAIIDEIAKDERIAALYDLWYEKKKEINRVYSQKEPEHIPLSRNKEFKAIKNIVIKEAISVSQEHNSGDFHDDDRQNEAQNEADELYSPLSEEPTEYDIIVFNEKGRRPTHSWWTDEYKAARTFLYGTKDGTVDLVQAFHLMKKEAAKGNGLAMHDLGKMYLLGLGCIRDEDTAQEWFRKALGAFMRRLQKEKNPGYMQYRIGKMYSLGYGTAQDYAKAAHWYNKSVSNDNPFAAYSLAGLYRRGQGVEQDDKKAFNLYTMAAKDEKSPNAYAMYELGRMFKDGIGTASDKNASDRWYKRAYRAFLDIEKKMADDKLYYRLGSMLQFGIGTEKDLKKAKAYYEKAAALGNTDALYGLGTLYLNKEFEERDTKRALEYLSAAAKNEHGYAQYTLGKLFIQGIAVQKSINYGEAWLEKAVKKDISLAQYLLGKILLEGTDLPQDTERAVNLLQKAISQGSAVAAYTLGKAYIDGILLSQNLTEGLRLIYFAAEKGLTSAEYIYGKLLYKGEIVPKNIGRSLYFLEKSADEGNPYAAYLAGKIRLEEEGYIDIQKAIRFLLIAAGKDHSSAELKLGLLYLRGNEVEKDEKQAIAWLKLSAEHGNQFAEQILNSMSRNRNWSAAMGALRLLVQFSRIIRSRIESGRKDGAHMHIDRKLRRKIEEKKQAHGLRQS